MRFVGVAGAVGTAFLLAACGGASDEPATEEMVVETGDAAASANDASENAADADGAALDDAAAAEAEAAPDEGTSAVAAAEPPTAFNQCRACHQVEAGEHGIGPSLAGVFGATAGTTEDFEFSAAMSESGMAWNEANLHAYLANPREAMPGNVMAYPGMRDEAQRQAVIDYLKTL